MVKPVWKKNDGVKVLIIEARGAEMTDYVKKDEEDIDFVEIE